MACCQDEAWNEVERLPVGTVKAGSSLSEDDFPEISRTFPLRVNEKMLVSCLSVSGLRICILATLCVWECLLCVFLSLGFVCFPFFLRFCRCCCCSRRFLCMPGLRTCAFGVVLLLFLVECTWTKDLHLGRLVRVFVCVCVCFLLFFVVCFVCLFVVSVSLFVCFCFRVCVCVCVCVFLCVCWWFLLVLLCGCFAALFFLGMPD